MDHNPVRTAALALQSTRITGASFTKMKTRALFGLSDGGRFLVWESVDVDPKVQSFGLQRERLKRRGSKLHVGWPRFVVQVQFGFENLVARGRRERRLVVLLKTR